MSLNEDLVNVLLSFLGGLGLFLYGMHIMAAGLQKTAGNKMKHLLEVLTKNKILGICVGALVTAVIQSSSATTVMVVGFVNAGIMNLTQAVGIIMGANIGTTITAWLVASAEWLRFFNPVFLAPLFVAIGASMLLFAKKDKNHNVGEIFVGFGILFIGMSSMSAVSQPIKNSPLFSQLFVSFGQNPLLGILAGAAVTALIQSSSASVAILQTLAFSGLIPWSAAVYIIMGQNIGTCVTAVISGLGATKNARAASYIHLVFNVVGSLVFSVFAIIYFKVINVEVAGIPISATSISIVHTIFNIGNTVLLYNFSDKLIMIAQKLAHSKEETDDEVSLVHLDERVLETPTFAIECTGKEIIRLGNIVIHSLKQVCEALLERDIEKADKVLLREKNIDTLSQAIANYLVRLSNTDLGEASNTTITNMFNAINDIERIGDHCENLAELTKFAIDEDISLSEIAVSEMQELINTTIFCYETAIKSLEERDAVLANNVVTLEEEIDVLEEQFRTNHIERLTDFECSPTTGVLFLDALSNLERIGDHSLNIAEYAIVESHNSTKHKK